MRSIFSLIFLAIIRFLFADQVGVWSIESSSRQSCVQSGQHSVQHNVTSGAQHSVTSLALVSGEKFLTGGTDCKIR